MPSIIPLQAAPAQTLSVQLNGQGVTISVYSLNTAGDILNEQVGVTADSTDVTADNTDITADATVIPALYELSPAQALYMDVAVDGAPLVTAKLCVSLSPIMLTSQYLGFEGELEFFDTYNLTTDAVTNPIWPGLGTQYQLVYFSPADVAAGLGGTYV